MSRLVTKPAKWHVRPAKTQISLGIHPSSLIRVFAVRMKKAQVLSYPLRAQQRLWSDWADAQADLSLRWAHRPHCWFCHEAAHIVLKDSLSQPLWKPYLSHKWTTNAQTSLRICTVSPEPSLFAHTILGTKASLGQRNTSLALLKGCTCTFAGSQTTWS